jgi:isoquinoline 1-oxidoreductase subunit alpha
MSAYKLAVNGATRTVDVEGETPLLWVLRDELGLLGTKFGCGEALCGACTVLLGEVPVRSCSLPVSAVGSAGVTTIEGVTGSEAAAVQRAWMAQDVPQCGYCQSGQIISAIALLKAIRKPTDHDIDRAMAGNLCRCATYVRIRAAIRQAARELGG